MRWGGSADKGMARIVAATLALAGCTPSDEPPQPTEAAGPSPIALKAALERYHHDRTMLATCEARQSVGSSQHLPPAPYGNLTNALLDKARRSPSPEVRRIVETTRAPAVRTICPAGEDIAARNFLAAADALAGLLAQID